MFSSFPLRLCAMLTCFSLTVVANAQKLVSVAEVQLMEAAPTLSLSGDLRATQSVTLAAEVVGVVDDIRAEAGDIVEQGEVLAVIREKPAALKLAALEAQLKEARAAAELAELVQRRFESLIATRAVSQEEYDAARVEHEQALAIVAEREAAVDEQADQLARHRIRAPFDGVIGERLLEKGQWLAAGDASYSIHAVEVLRVVLAVPQKYFGAVVVGAPVDIDVVGLDEPLHAQVSKIVPVVRRGGRTFEAWIDIDNRNLGLAPGMSLRARLGVLADAPMLVPRDAVLRRADGYTWVWVVEGDQVREVAVQAMGAREDNLVVRGDELPAGSRVVVRGNEGLRAGDTIRLQGEQ